MPFLEKHLCHILCPFLTGLFIILVVSCMSYLYILDINPLMDISFTNILFPFSRLLFNFLMVFEILALPVLFSSPSLLWSSENIIIQTYITILISFYKLQIYFILLKGIVAIWNKIHLKSIRLYLATNWIFKSSQNSYVET